MDYDGSNQKQMTNYKSIFQAAGCLRRWKDVSAFQYPGQRHLADYGSFRGDGEEAAFL